MPSPQEFIQQYGPQAAKVAQALKVDPAVILGQWGLETGWGKSVVPGTNNLGNIKDFSGGGVSATDNMTGSTDRYRSYATPDAFSSDFTGLIGRKYQGAIGAGSDAQKYATALKSGGYAEDPDYVPKLVAAADVVRKASNGGNAIAGALLPSAQAASGASISDKIKAARDAGYSDDEIRDYLSKSQGFGAKLNQAKQAGYSDDEIYGHLGLSTKTAQPTQPDSKTPGVVEGAARGFWQGLTDLPAGIAQSQLHQGQQILQAVDNAFGTHLADSGKANLDARDAEVAKREADYQAATPGSNAAGIGRVAGVITSSIGGGGPIKGGIQLGEQVLSRVAPNALARLVGEAGASALVGAGYGATAPVTSGDYGDVARGNALTGAIIGGSVPVAAKAISGTASAIKNTARNLIEPFSSSGQQRIAERMVQGAAQGGPTTVNAQQYVQGSTPTLAQATGNPRVAALERGLRNDPRLMNDFVARDAANSGARDAAFSSIAGDASDIAAAQGARDAAASSKLGQVFSSQGQANSKPVVDVIDNILTGPSGKRDAVKNSLMNIRSKIVNADDTLEANPETLYNSVRKQINDLIDNRMAASNPSGLQASRELLAVRDALDDAIESGAPGFKSYLGDYANASKPINAMEFLQGLKLTDARGNFTLAKVQSALSNITKQKGASGANSAKALTPQQIDVLTGIRDDLLRAEQTYAGTSRGSPTMQNIAIENLLGGLLPGRTGELLGNSALGGIAKRLGGVVYGGTDEQIRNKLAQLLLDPNQGAAVINRPLPTGPSLMNRLSPYIDAAGTFAPVNLLSHRN